MDADDLPNEVPSLIRQNSQERETYLLQYATKIATERTEIPLEEGWDVLKGYGVEVLAQLLISGMKDKKPFGNRGYSSLYTICFQMCSQSGAEDHSETLYSRINSAMAEFLRDHVVQPLLDPNLVGLPMITKFSQAWENHKIMVKWVQLLFRNLDSGYVANNSKPTITSCGLQLFLEVAFGGTADRVVKGVLDIIKRERNGDLVDRNELKNCVEVFIVMGLTQDSKGIVTIKGLLEMEQKLEIYQHHFEGKYLSDTREFYEAVSVGWRDNDTVADYLMKCETALEKEKDRVLSILHSSTEPLVTASLEHVLLSAPQLELINRPNSGLYWLLRERRTEDLKRMFRLFSRSGVDQGVLPMTRVFQQFVRDRGMSILDEKRSDIQRLAAEGKKENSSDIKMVLQFLQLHADCEAMVSDLFDNDIAFQKAMKDAFEFMNTNASEKFSNVELLVSYVDGVLKGKEGSDKLDEQAIEDRLNGTMKLFTFLTDKDLFAELYREHIAKRLLGDKSSIDLELSMVSKLKQSQGPPFTSKIEGMIKDFQMIDDSVKDFNKSKFAKSLPVESTVRVLTQGFWPSQTRVPIALPSSLQQVVTEYTKYYSDKHAEKKCLHWEYALGNCEVLGTFAKGKKFTMVVATLQAAALVQIAETPQLSTLELCEHLQADVDVVKRVLHSLSCGKHKILSKKGPGEPSKIHEQDSFQPNASFTSKVKKFAIPMANLENIKQIKQRVKEDRSVAIDAAVVRIMKARKKLRHQDLIGEVTSQLNQFKPDISQVKKRIESLIEREYLARREDASGNWTKEYEYLA